jgi:ribonucleoside-diphosphate reductase alpha chain
VLRLDGSYRMFEVEDYAHALWRRLMGDAAPLSEAFVGALELAPREHLAMQAALQPYVDSAISKTINVPESHAFAEFQDLYRRAFDLGLKGCTTFRPNPVTGDILSRDHGGAREAEAKHCCSIEREDD